MSEEEKTQKSKTIPSIIFVLSLVLLVTLFGWWWSDEPDQFPVTEFPNQQDQSLITGRTTTKTLLTVMETLLNKPGGYLSNDVLPPGILLDNIPNWEFGVLTQVRDLARVLRNDMSRSQSQSVDDKDLAKGEPQFHFDHQSWLFPSTEEEYRKGMIAVKRYLERLIQIDHPDAQFYARADNLSEWLALVEKRLGSLTQRLSASVGQVRVNIDLAGDASATQATSKPEELIVKTPWGKIDDVFYESRGAAWALIHFLKAIEVDFKEVLEKKNARVSLKQIIRELEATQETLWSPVVLNGSGFSLLANHSLVMASYMSTANAALIDLRALLKRG